MSAGTRRGPKVSTVIGPPRADGKRPSASSEEFVQHPDIRITPSEIRKPDGSTDHEGLIRILTSLHRNSQSATIGARTDPLAVKTIHQQVAFSGTPIVTGTGATVQKVTLTGTPVGPNMVIEIDITSTGGVGVAQFSWKLNGQTQQTAQTTAATFVLNGTGLTANFPAGTYTNGDVYKSSQPTVSICHGLGVPFGYHHCVRTYGGSQPFSAAELPVNQYPSGVTPDKYIVFVSYCTGTYDIAIFPAST